MITNNSLTEKISKIINSNPCHNCICWKYIPLDLREEILTDYTNEFGNPFLIQIIDSRKWHMFEWQKDSASSSSFSFKKRGERFDVDGENYITDRNCLYRLDFNPICQWWIGYKIAAEFTKQEQIKKKNLRSDAPWNCLSFYV